LAAEKGGGNRLGCRGEKYMIPSEGEPIWPREAKGEVKIPPRGKKILKLSGRAKKDYNGGAFDGGGGIIEKSRNLGRENRQSILESKALPAGACALRGGESSQNSKIGTEAKEGRFFFGRQRPRVVRGEITIFHSKRNGKFPDMG